MTDSEHALAKITAAVEALRKHGCVIWLECEDLDERGKMTIRIDVYFKPSDHKDTEEQG